jgi:hypothetical protein
MKSKKIVILMVGLIILFSLTSYSETKKLKRVGINTLVRIRGEIPVAEVMKTIVEKYLGDIKYGFDLVGYGDLYLPFVDQIKAAAFEEKELPIGDKLMWMLYRSRGRVKAIEDVEWAGKAPLPVFSFMVVKGYNHYEFIMPKPCGNVALRGVTEIIPDAICAIEVNPAKANINDPISVDMSGSQEAKSMEVEVFDENGNKVDSKKLTPDSPKWQTKFSKPGEYVFKGKAFNVKDKPSENPCEAKTYINSPPVSKLELSPKEEYVKKAITINAEGSSDPDGEVSKIVFEIGDQEGKVEKFTDKPLKWDKTFDKQGVYTITAVVTDDFNAVSEPYQDKVKIHKRWFTVLDFSGYFAGVRVGALGKEILFSKVDLLISAGAAYDFSTAYALANVLLVYDSRPRFSEEPGFFIGAGPGVSGGAGFEVEAVVDVGMYNVAKKLLFLKNVAFFGEVRISGTIKAMIGLRSIF